MLKILTQSLKTHRLAMLAMSLGLIAFTILVSASYEAFGQGSSFFGAAMPKGFSAFLGADAATLVRTGAQGYVAGLGLRHPIPLIILSAFAISTAVGGIAGEIDKRTMAFLLSQPVPRQIVILSKVMETALGLVILTIAILIGIVIGMAIIGVSVGASVLLLVGLNALLTALAIMGYSYLISSSFSVGGKASFIAIGITVAMYFLDYLSRLFDVLSPLGYVSIFHYYNPLDIVANGSISWLNTVVLLGVAVFTTAAAVAIFRRRDIAV